MQSRVLQYAIFLTVFSALVAALHAYLWQRLIRSPDLGATFTRYGTRGVIGLGLLLPVGMLASRFLPRAFASVVAWASYLWFGVAVVLFFLLLGSEVIRGAVHAAGAFNGGVSDERRQFLSRAIAAGVGALGVVVSGAGFASATGTPTIERVKVRLRRLPSALDGFRIVQISDLHIGPTLGKTWLEDVVAHVNAQNPDIVAITGDLVDGSVADLASHVAPLAKLKATQGVFFVTGNHEYYSGADEWIAYLRTLGVRVLRNERVEVGSGDHTFDLAGVDDFASARWPGHGPDLASAVEGRDPTRELILLAHQPKQIFDSEKHGVGLQLSGHTHGGQIFPWGYAVKLDQPHLQGLERRGETQIYTNRGTGYWGPPMRVGVPSEISVLELHSDSSNANA
ncbi:MAG: metallophosphoesterase [Polyangiaceae bacterium]